jgi:hypothetical protein
MSAVLAAAVSLWVGACIDGRLHDVPTRVCHEFQIRSYPTIAACEKARTSAVSDWLTGLAPYGLSLHVASSRCGPAEADGDDI